MEDRVRGKTPVEFHFGCIREGTSFSGLLKNSAHIMNFLTIHVTLQCEWAKSQKKLLLPLFPPNIRISEEEEAGEGSVFLREQRGGWERSERHKRPRLTDSILDSGRKRWKDLTRGERKGSVKVDLPHWMSIPWMSSELHCKLGCRGISQERAPNSQTPRHSSLYFRTGRVMQHAKLSLKLSFSQITFR